MTPFFADGLSGLHMGGARTPLGNLVQRGLEIDAIEFTVPQDDLSTREQCSRKSSLASLSCSGLGHLARGP
jgi:hypothetical protein